MDGILPHAAVFLHAELLICTCRASEAGRKEQENQCEDNEVRKCCTQTRRITLCG